MKTDDRIRKAEWREGDFSLENIISREEERDMLYRAAYNSRTRLPADFPAIFITTGLVRGVIFHIPLSCWLRLA